MKFLSRCIFCFLVMEMAFVNARSQTFVFARLDGSPVNTSGWNPQGACYTGNTPVGTGNSEVILTDPVNSSSGSIFYQTPINLSACRKWFAEFDFRMFDGTQADGMSFCYLDNPPVGAVTGGGLGIPPAANGLKICFDTWRNCATDNIPKIQIRWGVGYDECNGQPTRNNNDGTIGFIRGNSYNHCKIEYDQGNISVFVNNVLYLTGFQTFNFPGYFGFTASTGGFTDRHSVKNAIIYTEMPPSLAGVDASICPKDSAQLGGALDAALSYLWSPSVGMNDPTSSNPKVGLDNAGLSSYTQKYIVKTAFITNPGCASQDTVDVVVRARPLVDFSATESCLPNARIQFNHNIVIGDGQPPNYIYAWNFGDPNASLLNPNTSVVAAPAHTYTTAGPFTVSLSAISVQGCKGDTVKQIFSIKPQPKAMLQSPPEVCMGTAALFTDASDGMGSNLSSWNWDFGDGSFSTQQNPAHTYATAGNFTIKLFVDNAIGCRSDTAVAIITVNPLPTVAFTAPATGCQANTIQFTDISVVNAGNITGWNWNFGDGVLDSIQNPAHRYFNYGNINVTLVVVTNKGCTKSTVKPIIIYPSPSVDFNVLANCSGSNALFTNLSQVAGGTQNDLSFFWRFNDANATPANADTSLLINPSHTFIMGGTYNVNLRASTIFGCTTNVVKPLTINGKPQVITSWQNNFCSNVKQTFVDSSIVPFGSLAQRTIYWDWENNPTVFVADNAPALGKIYQNKYPSFGGSTPRRMVIRNIALSANGCTTERFDSIQLLPSPQLVFDSITPVCISPVLLLITAARETSGSSGSGVYSGKGIDAGGMFDATAAGVGVHRLTYIFTPANGCADTAYGSIAVNSSPTVYAGTDKTIIEGGTALLEGSFSANVVAITWLPAQTLSSAVIARPLASPLTDTWYTVKGVSDKSCTATDSVLVKVLPALKIPNVFSPNRDGINDVWNIPYLSSYTGCTLDIFDRYGRKIFSSVGYNQPWDGTLLQKDLPAGVYYYRLDIKNGKPAVSGSVTVIR